VTPVQRSYVRVLLTWIATLVSLFLAQQYFTR
jgi:hypothetical protein